MGEIIFINKGEFLEKPIPVNAVVYKKTTGIGATTIEIESPRNSIIIEPNTPVIEGKTKKHKNLFGIFEGITTEQIIKYLHDNAIQYKKLMTTPESFGKLKKAFYLLGIDMYSDYFLLFDECHKLTSEIDFRETILLPIQDFWKFKERSVVSASVTNFESYGLFRKHGFKSVTIEPNYNHALKVNLYSSNNILQDIKNYFERNPISPEKIFCFFINSIDIIISIIQKLYINKEKTNIYCASKSLDKLSRRGYENIYTHITELNQYNFYTSRFFSAVDIITDHKPHIIVVSDAIKAPQTIIEPLLESRQIAGRFRNGIFSFTHIAGLDKNIEAKSYKESQSYLKEQRKAYIQLKTLYESATEAGIKQVMKEALERVEISKYLEEDGSFNFFMTENLLDSEAAKIKYKTWKDFILSYSLDEYFKIENQYNNTYAYETEKLKISTKNSLAFRKEIVDTFFAMELDYGIYTEEQKQAFEELKRKDEFIIEICQNFDKNFILVNKYKKQPLTLALIKKRTKEKTISFPVIEAVLQLFRIDSDYTEKEITDNLAKIYQLFEIEKTPKATDINEYFDISKRKTIKRNNQFLKGYKLLKAKYLPQRT